MQQLTTLPAGEVMTFDYGILLMINDSGEVVPAEGDMLDPAFKRRIVGLYASDDRVVIRGGVRSDTGEPVQQEHYPPPIACSMEEAVEAATARMEVG